MMKNNYEFKADEIKLLNNYHMHNVKFNVIKDDAGRVDYLIVDHHEMRTVCIPISSVIIIANIQRIRTSHKVKRKNKNGGK